MSSSIARDDVYILTSYLRVVLRDDDHMFLVKFSPAATMRLIQPRVIRLCHSSIQTCISRPLPKIVSASSISNHERFASNMSGPPKHEMIYFPNMTAALPASSAVFRKVLWTGLYSQVVLMTIPVGGDIGEEVWIPSFALNWVQLNTSYDRFTPSTKH